MEKIKKGENMKNIKGIIISVIVIIVLISTTVFIVMQGKSKASQTEDLEEKVNAEIEYLDDKILSMLNNLNGIVLRNYIVSSEKVGENSKKNDDNTSEAIKKSENQEAELTSKTDSDTQTNVYELNAAGILSTERNVDWETLKSEIEIMNSSWATVILDLYKLNINSEDILAFSTLLDRATIAIDQENKSQVLQILASMYNYFPRYLESFSDDLKKINIEKTKASLINAYSIVETQNWNEITKQISNAEIFYLNVLNSVSTEENYDINKGYILLKELQNSLGQQDADVFYIKYKNLLEKLNNI